jgi:outer membrane lipoprotein-sorting protein
MRIFVTIITIIAIIALLDQHAWATADLMSRCRGIAQIDLRGQSIIDGRDLVEETLHKVQTFNDYSCECICFSFLHPQPRQSQAHFQFKKPNLIRVQISSNDFRNGSIVARCPDGRIKGAGGGLLSALVMDLDEDSRMLKLPSGRNVLKSDFNTVLTEMKSEISGGSICKATKAPTTVQALDGKETVYVVDLYKQSPSGDSLVQRLLIDPNTSLPVEWAYFRDGQIVSTVAFHNISINKGVSNDVFQL